GGRGLEAGAGAGGSRTAGQRAPPPRAGGVLRAQQRARLPHLAPGAPGGAAPGPPPALYNAAIDAFA
ncbi:hypothetical protein APUTEX25_002166, partial [Auxenochlorella protothecoides]